MRWTWLQSVNLKKAPFLLLLQNPWEMLDVFSKHILEMHSGSYWKFTGMPRNVGGSGAGERKH